MKNPNRKPLGYQYVFNTIRDYSGKVVAKRKGHQIVQIGRSFINNIESTMKSSKKVDYKQRIIKYSIVTKKGKVIGTTDHAMNVFDLNGNYVGSITNLNNWIGVIAYTMFTFLLTFLLSVSMFTGTNESYSKEIKIRETTGEFVTDEFNVFGREEDMFGNEEYLRPGIAGSYHFDLVNDFRKETHVTLDFEEVNETGLVMKYRLYSNGQYLAGGKDEWVTVNELDVDEIIILKRSHQAFRLDWYWETVSDEHDTMIGTTPNASYTIQLTITNVIY